MLARLMIGACLSSNIVKSEILDTSLLDGPLPHGLKPPWCVPLTPAVAQQVQAPNRLLDGASIINSTS